MTTQYSAQLNMQQTVNTGGFFKTTMLGRGWKGGSAKAAVKGYITRKGKRVKAHTRRVAARQAKQASNQILGRAVTRIITGRQGRLMDRVWDELWKALQPKPVKGKGRGRK